MCRLFVRPSVGSDGVDDAGETEDSAEGYDCSTDDPLRVGKNISRQTKRNHQHDAGENEQHAQDE